MIDKNIDKIIKKLKIITMFNIFLFCTSMIFMIYVLYSSEENFIFLKRKITSMEITNTNYVTKTEVLKHAVLVDKQINDLYSMSYYLTTINCPVDGTFENNIYCISTTELDSIYNNNYTHNYKNVEIYNEYDYFEARRNYDKKVDTYNEKNF
jgi:hypothetical protein